MHTLESDPILYTLHSSLPSKPVQQAIELAMEDAQAPADRCLCWIIRAYPSPLFNQLGKVIQTWIDCKHNERMIYKFLFAWLLARNLMSLLMLLLTS